MEYQVIYSMKGLFSNGDKLVKEFENEVNEAIKEGWRLQGGIAIHFDGNDLDELYQAMVKD